MHATASCEITALLRAWSQGEEGALERLIPLVDQHLRAIARQRLESRRSDPILDTTTALVNEAYLRLIDRKQSSWQDRAHFFAVCAKTMRRILVDHARARQTAKRGGGAPSISLNEALAAATERSTDLVAIDEALESLSRFDERKGRVVELRFFGGLTIEQTAEVLKVSPETVRRDWRLARAWLVRELGAAETA
jgi:RNA polymerase sigma-70 factor (ECF subfamily)